MKKFLVAMVAISVLAACREKPPANARPTPSKAKPHRARIGYLPIYVDLPVFVAAEKGFFRERGVEVELVRFAKSPDMGTALLTGDVDAAASIATSVALSIETRDPNKLKIFLVDSETPERYLSSFVVTRHSGISSMAQLKGKRIASFPGPTALTFGRLVLEKYQLRPGRDVQFFELDAASHLTALQARTVDALFTYEPISTQAVLENDAVKLLPGAVEREIINPWQAGVWVASSQFMQEHPTEYRAVVAAIMQAAAFIDKHPVDAKAFLTKYTSIKPAVAAATPNIPFKGIHEADLDALQRHSDILQAQGVISKRVDVRTLLAR